MLGTDLGNARERRLIKHFRSLNATDRETLGAFAEFLAQRQVRTDSTPDNRLSAPGSGKQAEREPRPAEESVIAAMKRLRRSYPELEASNLLNEASLLMSAHMIQGRPAIEVIDELEALFARHERERI
ncbi:hypothetical protein Thiowin_02125 [Thiorhodovibrio winogradskyi]|uniref:Crp/Fnr family transcriptional regulator n=1 Tax=Thiorhodovibrio winogradskyi TaxID=77007 RepID=A0ABZ0S9F2_9GAMM|nr:hypothetical protein [Thiorhodovibrio winogradskyi]